MELVINNVSKQYGNKLAVNNLSATLTEGIHAMLGANGSGKTTLMRMISDLLQPTSGQVLLNNKNISDLGEDYRELLGYLPQNFGYYPNFTGWDFMIYLAALKGLPKHTAFERSEDLLKKFGLFDVRGKKLKTYSGGMRQRIGIAQALLNNPRILILDEPTSGLDPKERTNFRNIISELSKDRIIIISTHIVPDVEHLADNILFVKEGKLILQDKTAGICDSIANQVWQCYLEPEQVNSISDKWLVSRLQREGNLVKARVVSNVKPCANATPLVPELEDLYLYHFQEEAKSDGYK